MDEKYAYEYIRGTLLPYHCTKCNNKQFKTKFKAIQHWKMCGIKLERNVKCTECDYTTKHWTSLKYHMEKQHKIIKKNRKHKGCVKLWPCTHCTFKTIYRKNLKPHLLRIHKVVQISPLKNMKANGGIKSGIMV